MGIRKVMTSEISATLMKLRHPQQRSLRMRRRKVRKMTTSEISATLIKLRHRQPNRLKMKMTTSEILVTLMKLRHRQQHKLKTKRRMMKKMMTLETLVTLMRLRPPLLSHLPYPLLQIYLDQISRPKTPTKSMVSTMSTRMQPLSRMNFCLTYSGFKIPMMMTQT